MAGTFGLKEGMLGYELSQAVGQPLFDAFKGSGVEAVVTESSVCKIQLLEGTGMRVYHPLEIPV
jgi:Fe-S oxidoreductase